MNQVANTVDDGVTAQWYNTKRKHVLTAHRLCYLKQEPTVGQWFIQVLLFLGSNKPMKYILYLPIDHSGFIL
jgi:hypothetical protein